MNEFRLDPESLVFTLITKKTDECRACTTKDKAISSMEFLKGFVRIYEIKDDVQPSKYELVGDFFKSSNADGYEEILVDSEKHENNLMAYGVEEIEKLLNILVNRVNDLQPERENELEPYKLGENLVISRSSGGHGYFDLIITKIPKKEGKLCFGCESIKNSGNREVYKTENFVVYVPFAPKYGFELVIAPRQHLQFKLCDSSRLFDLAAIIKKIFNAFGKELNMAVSQNAQGHFKVTISNGKLDSYSMLGINRVENSPDILAKEIRDSKKL